METSEFSGLLEERAEIRDKLKGVRIECDQLQGRYEEVMAVLRGLEISLRCAVKGREKLETRVEEIGLAIADAQLLTPADSA